jgi:hypothetical protein
MAGIGALAALLCVLLGVSGAVSRPVRANSRRLQQISAQMDLIGTRCRGVNLALHPDGDLTVGHLGQQ